MPARASRCLVIDASVARASGGEDATYPTSKRCRDFLTAVHRICHRVVMTSEIGREWKEHQSNFARQWRVSMQARRKVCRVDVTPNDMLYDKVKQEAANDKTHQAMLNDLHLIEAALITDRTVVSLDESARGLFAEMAERVGELKNVSWVNPDRVDEQPIRWLEEGARPEKSRRLGSGA